MKTYTESELQELKPCPFCGGNAEIKQTGKNELTIRCMECLTGKTQAVLRYSLDWLKDKLIEGWNNRPSPLLPTEEVVTKEDDGCCSSGNMVEGCVCWNLVNGKGGGTKWNIIEPATNPDEASLASHSCTVGNSIQRELTTDELLKRLESVKYKSFGFPMVMLWRVVDDLHEHWSCRLRNEQNWKEAEDCEGKTPKEALQKLYDYCIEKGYMLNSDKNDERTIGNSIQQDEKSLNEKLKPLIHDDGGQWLKKSEARQLRRKAKALADGAWYMLPDSCKEIMGESLKKTFTESLTEDIIHQFKK